MGLQPISHHCALLLGHGARPWGPDSGDWETKWSEWWSAEIQDAAPEMNGWFLVGDPTNNPNLVMFQMGKQLS